jgi:hypothetical protein
VFDLQETLQSIYVSIYIASFLDLSFNAINFIERVGFGFDGKNEFYQLNQ